MKFELLILGISGFLIANTYYDGKYIKLLQSWQKYFKMASFAFVGLSIYLYVKKNPDESKPFLTHASEIIKHMPMTSGSMDVLTPFLDFSNQTSFYPLQNSQRHSPLQPGLTHQQSRILESGKKSTKRCVSETKKKFVAAQQSWNCGNCKKQLPAWFEVDHKIRLEYGGSNHVDNLVALCRDCHGRKTAMENL
jgi:hypothetical protein